jgi:hypothetical protein
MVAGGCAAQHRPAPGWRLAVVTRLGDALPSRDSGVSDCRSTGPNAATPQRGYAEVAYRVGQRARHRIALLPDGERYFVGEDVYVNVRDCAVALSATPP